MKDARHKAGDSILTVNGLSKNILPKKTLQSYLETWFNAIYLMMLRG